MQCCCLALHNAHGLFPGHIASLPWLLNTVPVRNYSAYTGSRTGHGFFAPQVASMFILQLRQETPQGTVVWTGPDLRSVAAKTRYVAFLNYCQYLQQGTTKEDSLRRRQVKAIIHRLADDVMPTRPGYATRCIVYAVQHAPLGMPAGAAAPQLAILYDSFIHTTTP